jgi:hypothetical protein
VLKLGLARRITIPLSVAILVVLALASVAVGERGGVDWRRVRAVVFESDDWGLCGFVPDSTAWHGLDRDTLRAGRVPQAYWGSTLEDSAAVLRLCRLLLNYRGWDGLPPIFQANYIVSSLSYEPEAPAADPGGGPWRRYDLPALPPPYARNGLWDAVAWGVAAGVWRPEFHGAFHYDPGRRREAVRNQSLARVAAERGILPFAGSARAWELGPWRPTAELAGELDRSLAVFRRVFHRPPASIIAPDYVWDGRCEDLWESRGLTTIQAKREQRHPRWRSGRIDHRLCKVVARAWERLLHPRRTYLERNSRLESARARDATAVADDCWRGIQAAWRRGQPAIVETHRVNFVHVDAGIVAGGLVAMTHLLDRLQADPLSALFLCDSEVAQLQRTGTSCSLRDSVVVLRNLTASRRVISLPDSLQRQAAAPGTARTAPVRLCMLAPYSVRIVPQSAFARTGTSVVPGPGARGGTPDAAPERGDAAGSEVARETEAGRTRF